MVADAVHRAAPRGLLGVVLAVTVLLTTGARPAAAYVAPVPGRVVEPFDAAPAPWGPGHRGVDLLALPGERVVAAGAGKVSFAGAVAGETWLTIVHASGLRTSYGPLARTTVEAGATVAEGQVVGTVGAGHGRAGTLHWSLRDGEGYLDPLVLLGDLRPSLVGSGTEWVTDLPTLPSYEPWSGRQGLRGFLGLVEDSPTATGAGWVLAPNPNHVIGVAGLGSSSTEMPIDLSHLGYATDAITYLSYAGRTKAAGRADDPRRDQIPYSPPATFGGVHEAALRLRDQLRAHHARAPGEAVDLVGHSMGGVVIVHYLLTMHDPADPGLPPIGHVATIASPLEGADMATAIQDAARSRVMRALMTGVGRLVGLPAPDAPAADDLALDSPLLRDIRAAWEEARSDVWASPLATGTRVLTMGGSYDLVVPEHRSDLPGAAHVVVPGGHAGVRDTEASRIVLREFLADRPHPGAAGGLGHLLSYPLGWTERQVGWGLGRIGRPPGVPAPP